MYTLQQKLIEENKTLAKLNDNIPNAMITDASIPKTLRYFRSIIRLQNSCHYYKHTLRYSSGQFNPMFGCDSFI